MDELIIHGFKNHYHGTISDNVFFMENNKKVPIPVVVNRKRWAEEDCFVILKNGEGKSKWSCFMDSKDEPINDNGNAREWYDCLIGISS